jgi:hypothetical protein
MRKLFWCCTAAGVLAAGGVCAVARYACCPESLVYRSAAAVAALMHPLAGLGLTAAGRCARGPAAEETATRAGLDEDDDVPGEPTPAPIVIREEGPAVEESEPPQAQDHCTEPGATGTLCPPATVEQTPPCPMTMPYCTDEEARPAAVPVMPQADESPLAREAKTLFQFWVDAFGNAKEETGGEETAEPARADGAPNCQEDAHYHEHYSGCPYTGYHLPSQRCPVTPARAVPGKRQGEDECSEEPAPKKHKAHYPGKCGKGEECPKHPDVDTMEYRRSDGGLNEYGPGPF